MLESVKYMTIRDICVKDLYFYQEEQKNELIRFCQDKAISYIPDKDRKSCWQLKGERFIHIQQLPADLVCAPQDMIFAEETLRKFEMGNHDEVMFVMENGLIKGIVHIVDYNNTDLFVEIYRMLLTFENNLRQLLTAHRQKNQDFIDWLQERGKKNSFYRDLYKKSQYKDETEKRLNANPFQTFYLKDLLLFARSKTFIHFSNTDLDDIAEVRNWIAHSKDVTAIKINSKHAVYNINGLKDFIRMTQSFFRIYDELEIILDKMLPQKALLIL